MADAKGKGSLFEQVLGVPFGAREAVGELEAVVGLDTPRCDTVLLVEGGGFP